MIQLTVDFETFYSTEFSLSKMQTDAYVLDPRFEVIGVAVAEGDAPAQWFSGDMVATRAWLHQFDWANAAALCHNTNFDGFILSQIFDIRPKLWMDTLGMARRRLPWLPSHSLAALGVHYRLPPKGGYVTTALGRRREDFTADELAAYGDYCCHDAHLTHLIGEKLLPDTPPLELRLIDMTVRMFTEPQFVGDVPLLHTLHQDELARKAALLEKWGGDKATLMSNPKLAEALRQLGVSPPMKISARTGKEAFAFAKSDEEFTALLDHPDERVQTLVAARLGVKTTIAETRALRFLETAQRGPMPVYLNYCGAKTTQRHSGGDKCLVGDTEITVLRGGEVLCIMLFRLRPTDRVWDGEEFVAHGGLLFQGYAEVMTYDGITGTSDHKVWVEGQDGPIRLGTAAAGGHRLQTRGAPSTVEQPAQAVPDRKG